MWICTSGRNFFPRYAEGELGEDKSVYFRGPERLLNLRGPQNLNLFVQIGEGVDDLTWTHHLRAGDYSCWLAEAIGDDELAAEIAAVECDASLDTAISRTRIKEAITRGYTAPA